jgi:uncharacterized membrane protein
VDLLSGLILALILLLVAHLVEEIKTGFRHKLIIGTMPLPVFIGINTAIYLFCAATLFFSLTNNKLAAPFAWIFAVAMLFNGLGHICIMTIKRGYFPGGVTAFLLVPVAVSLIVCLANI